jgi:CRP-like cAMP-binding protein
MYELFLQKLRANVEITDEQEALVRKYLTPKKLRKRQYLLHEGEVAKSAAFVERGAMRSYTIGENGAEHIAYFALEGQFISDLNSFLKGGPATYNIVAIEDSDLVLITRSAHEELTRQIPHFWTFLLAETTDAYLALQKRLMSIISRSLDDRYEAFVQLFPELIQRVPQHMIASYMGLSPETLSRIRGRIKHG